MSAPGRKVERPEPTKSAENGKHVSSPVFRESFPALWEFLAVDRDFGENHKTGCVTLFIDGDKLKLCANDRPARQSCFLSGDGLLEVLCRLDRGLMEGSLRWSKQTYRRRSRA